MWPDAEKTQDLLADAKEGDADAVNRLMDRHRDSLRRMVQLRLDHRIQKRIDVSDIVQDVLVEANRRLQDYLAKPVMPYHLWLRQIAQDRIIDAHRRHRVSAKRSVDKEPPVADRVAPTTRGTPLRPYLPTDLPQMDNAQHRTDPNPPARRAPVAGELLASLRP